MRAFSQSNKDKMKMAEIRASAQTRSTETKMEAETHDDGRVPGRVLGHDDTVALLLPLRRLVLHVGDGDRQLHRGASVPAVRRYDVPGDVASL